tara:strand:- start:105938 stop:106177 length:240 start_codon:yes stop_codon:yes gene_type:complete
MARARRQARVPTKQEAYKYKTRYGSHADMIDEEKTSELNDKKLAVLEDEHGYYITERHRIDNGLADPKRYTQSRLKFFK